MDNDEFDQLVDDATQAVNNLIPDQYLDWLDAEGRSALLSRINDALRPGDALTQKSWRRPA